ncbi:MAG: hypothetical protein IT376_04110 [Polyangiaceae bacterium]|nr:hypothetical protein [Polyangiaceae bacterium]
MSRRRVSRAHSSRRVALAMACGFAGVAAARAQPARGAEDAAVVLFADRDDDDDDGLPDAVGARVADAALTALELAPGGPAARRVEGEDARLIVGGRPVREVGAGAREVRLQGLRAGSARLHVGGRPVTVQVIEVFILDREGARVDPARGRIALGRSLPRELTAPGVEPELDDEEVRWGLAGPAGALPAQLELVSRAADGQPVDSIVVGLLPVSCPPDTPSGVECRQSGPIRGSVDEVERRHPALERRALVLRVGGRVVARVNRRDAQSVRVGAPRALPGDRYRARLRVRLVRSGVGAGPPVGADDAEALRLVRLDLEAAERVWGQCGFGFGGSAGVDLAIVDPPPPYLVAVGCESGLPASGGRVSLRAKGKLVELTTQPGASPIEVAVGLAHALVEAGVAARVSRNGLTGGGALATADVLAFDERGAPLELTPDAERPLSTDPTLGVCLGRVDLSDGLTHFSDHDSAAGTLEERTLLKAVLDADPATVDLVFVPAFMRTGRIGESFIQTDGGSIANAIVLDRAGLRVGGRSNVLAHELGHVLLDLPGHPDDFGPDTTASLMDADAADPTLFGPRKLSLAECRRALIESGPSADAPLLVPWPLTRPRVTPAARSR